VAITLLASACPAVQGPAGLVKLSDAASAAPTLLSAAVIDGGTNLSSKINKNAQFLELLARYGPKGVFGVAYGLTISVVSGLTIEVAAGHAIMESIIELSADTEATAFDNTNSYVWLKQDGTIEVVNNAVTAPAMDAVYLGRVTASGGTVSGTIEYAGRVDIIGNIALRQTADTEIPSDTPSSSLAFFTKTLNGTWMWDGSSWLRVGGTVAEYGYVSIALSDANYTLSAAEYRRKVVKLTGTLSATRNLVLPTVAGAIFIIDNQTTQSLVVKTNAGTGPTIATTKRATLYCDGTDYIRVTADA
jgi:hypothetical protein